ncbi:unnamed protein product [Didymodactylos carnosus]|uniref:Uncharacterized protein n=1 Tax=Didymodactylos carnosus TaxID=1234261 RepID=A0A814AF66_9BILA|nr:unnamed protein product [Didymodactylos carnosus]CAF0911021.1 unnamed protein product [Didymodactylos carnosus]CAF3541599.1 unnamed protein product [Didymodactylos carnosus]CAF3692126.1 unnamed protein product [Didymodactylos carnosus]
MDMGAYGQGRPSTYVFQRQSVRYMGSDPSTGHKSKSQNAKSTSGNKDASGDSSSKLDKTGSKIEKQEQKSATKSAKDRNDTKQPGTTPRDWQPGQKPTGNDPKYGTGASDEPNPKKTT